MQMQIQHHQILYMITIIIVVENPQKQCSTAKKQKHRTQYLSQWETKSEARFKCYVCDNLGGKKESLLCWLYYENNAMRCRLCEKYGKIKNTNGKNFFKRGLLVDFDILVVSSKIFHCFLAQ